VKVAGLSRAGGAGILTGMADDHHSQSAGRPEPSEDDSTGVAPVTEAERVAIRRTILDELGGRGNQFGITPQRIAQSVRGGGSSALLDAVRAEAVALANAGRIAIVRKGRIANPNNFSGSYTMRAPWDDPHAPADAWS